MVAPSDSVDVAIVGGGLGGLTAAWHLQDLDLRILEADNRVGGRINSVPRGDYFLSFGAHMFPGADSVVAGLVREMGLELLPIDASLLGVSYRGKTLIGGRAEFYPFRLPLSWDARIRLIRTGLKLRRDAKRYSRLARDVALASPTERRTELLRFQGDTSFREYVGTLSPEAWELMIPVARRMTAEPEEVSAGAAIALFAHVFARDGSELAYSLRGGPSMLPEALGRRLSERIVLAAPVTEIRREQDHVRVSYSENGEPRQLRARAAIVTAPPPASREMLVDAPTELLEALEQITYGPMVVLAILTDETTAMPWDNMYSLVTPNRPFTMIFNHAAAFRKKGGVRKPGGTLMAYAGARLARILWNRADQEIEDWFLRDIYDVFPEARGVVAETMVKRWSYTGPFAAPGRHRLQQVLERGIDNRIFFAGDFVGDFIHMESAAETAVETAERVRQALHQARATTPIDDRHSQIEKEGAPAL